MLVWETGRCGWGHAYVRGTPGSGIVSSTADVLGMSVVRGMRSWWSV